MELNQYERILIKCDYISAVCDQLLQSTSNSALSHLYRHRKIALDDDSLNLLTNHDKAHQYFLESFEQEKKQYQRKSLQLQQRIHQTQCDLKKNKRELSSLKELKYYDSNHSRQVTKKIREISSLQVELMQQRRLLNSQMKNLNTIQTSNIEVVEALQDFDKKQVELKMKTAKNLQKEKQFQKYREMQDCFEELLDAKRKIIEENANFEQKHHTESLNKISAIGQSNQNLTEMDRYLKQLQLLIQEQRMIIEEIQSRETTVKTKQKQLEDDQEDSRIFQLQVDNLRKTIANRQFKKKKAKSLHFNHKTQVFLDESMPKKTKNIQIQKSPTNKNQHEEFNSSIFKIQIQPISHFNASKMQKQNQNAKVPKNSLPLNITQHKKTLSPKKIHKGLSDLESREIQTLQQILKKKQEQMKKLINGSKHQQINESTLLQKRKNQTDIRKLNNTQRPPSSRFIEQIIQSRDKQHLNELKNNVRIRTKKSQSEKYKYSERRRNLSLQKIYKSKNESFSSPKITIDSDTKIIQKSQDLNKQKNHSSLPLPEILQPKNSQKKYDTSLTKYKDNLSKLEHQKKTIESVFKKIEQIKKGKYQTQATPGNKEASSKQNRHDKIKIFKLSSIRKYGNSVSFQRKGKAEGVEEPESQSEKDLPRIEEEEESIRNTIQSLAENGKTQLQK